MISHHAIHPYPVDFPRFNREGYAMELDLGLIRSEANAVLTNLQRRSFSNLPTMITVTANVPATKLYDFMIWLNGNVGLWVDLPLAHPFMARNNQEEIVPARIIDFSFPNSYQLFGYVVAALTLQLSPTVFIDANVPSDIYEWVLAGNEPFPSPDWVIAGRARDFADEWILAGTATSPGGV